MAAAFSPDDSARKKRVGRRFLQYHAINIQGPGQEVDDESGSAGDKPNMTNQDYCLKFEGILNKRSMDIIIFTIEYLQKEITEMDKQIEGIQQQLTSTLTTDKFDTLKQKIDKTIDDFKNVLQERKRTKFLRDTEDYHRNTVYRWRDVNTQRDRRQYRRDTDLSRPTL
ncbi:unnamed protein product [Ranitomeya imitator]|uniref:Uncharacterized protein n=1 Tax=Ranitomeya imitator TaxID=111125 RepID=A0ABN9LVG4_9NEOB|nr:unnamed protein product [Ranitomeya imitator]